MEMYRIWQSLAGLGIFMFGMYLLEESVRLLSGKAFKHFIRTSTSTPFRGVTSGVVATAILQSSSAVSLMVLAFTGAGVMTTQSAISVVIGSNLGTSFTAWLVALLGFKLKIELLSLPFIGIGGLLLIFSGTRSKWTQFSKLLVGFGFLFMGLDYMKAGVESMANTLDLEVLLGLPNILFLVAGIILTALIQSSSAAMAIILSSLYSGLFGFETACFMVIGINIGTTVTIFIASAGGAPSKKKVAISHIIFNLVTGLIMLLLMPVIMPLFIHWLVIFNDPVTELALFHTLFNLTGVLMFFPFIHLLGTLADKIIQEKQQRISRFIHLTPAEITEGAVSALHNEGEHLLRMVSDYIINCIKVKLTSDQPTKETLLDKIQSTIQDFNLQYMDIKYLQASIFQYAAEVQKHDLSITEAGELNAILHSVRYAVSSAKSVKDILHDLDVIDESEIQFAHSMREKYNKIAIDFIRQTDHLLTRPNVFDLAESIYTGRQMLYRTENENILEITGVLKESLIPDVVLSSLLSANRNICTAGRQLLLATKELMFSVSESAVYEKLEHESIDAIT